MPQVKLIDPAAIPTAITGRAALIEATEHLKEALRTNQALTIRLEQSERAACVTNTYKRAAKDLGIGMFVSTGEKRTYMGNGGVERQEPAVLYVRIVKAAAPTPAPAASFMVRRPVVVTPAKPVYDPITHAEISR
jgi:hypothetical protein